MPATSDFRPPFWIRNPHLQTIWGSLTRQRHRVLLRREVLTTPDDDDLVIDHLDQPDASVRCILLHGLEGSSNSVYIHGLLRLAADRGWSTSVLNFRSCAHPPGALRKTLPNRGERLYHSGETTDFDFLLRTLHAREADVTLIAAGASLGGNVLLKWLGEHPSDVLLAAAATVSVPYDLAAGARYLERWPSRLYVTRFLRTLLRKAHQIAERSPEAASRLDLAAAKRARTFAQFDDAATAPLHGFRDASDYFAQSSSLPFIERITVPTLCISAEDDPFLPPSVLEEVARRRSPMVELLVTRHGGHVGFVHGRPWRSRYWAEEVMIEWLASRTQSDVRSGDDHETEVSAASAPARHGTGVDIMRTIARRSDHAGSDR